jgi:glycerophosphoryl diester phosphodiesterase
MKSLLTYLFAVLTFGSELAAQSEENYISFAPTHDRLKTAEERRKAYEEEIKKSPDIIESDLPAEVWKTVNIK